MLNFSHQTRVFLFLEPVDMRKSFRGLCQLCESVLKAESILKVGLRLKIDPYAYLKDVFERLPVLMQNSSAPDVPTLLVPLLPDHWLADHPETQLQIRTSEANTKSAARRSARTRRRKGRNQAQQNGS